MKQRRAIVVLELETDIPLPDLKSRWMWSHAGNVLQVQVNSAKGVPRARRRPRRKS